MLRRHSTQHCKGAQADNPPANISDPSPNSEDAASFCKSVTHDKPPAAPGEQHFSNVLPHKPPSSSASPAQTAPHIGTPPHSLHLSPASTPSPLPELRSLVPHHLLSSSHQERNTTLTGTDHLKLTKPHLSQEPEYGPYVENGSVSVGRPYVPTADNRCTSLTSGRSGSGSYRSNEGQFISSVTLWGLAMKTLQNDNDMDQWIGLLLCFWDHVLVWLKLPCTLTTINSAKFKFNFTKWKSNHKNFYHYSVVVNVS